MCVVCPPPHYSCGTGLCGVELAGCAAELHGVDLSPEMVAKAACRCIYTSLEACDLTEWLTAQAGVGRTFDAAFATDVFVYIGQLGK